METIDILNENSKFGEHIGEFIHLIDGFNAD